MTIITDTHNKSVVPIAQDTRKATFSSQWFLEKAEDRAAPVRHNNNLHVYICGEEAFSQIADDLKKAKSSVEIICWGFDPAMELTRKERYTWPRGDTWGDLLRDVAAGKYNDGKPVQVRLLSWCGFIGSTLLGAHNMPGYSHDSKTTAQRARSLNSDDWTEGVAVTRPDQRKDFNATWYQDAFHGRIEHLAIRTRNNDRSAVNESLKDEAGKRGKVENLGLKVVPTDHQKTILIDYEYENGMCAVGYVMGLNSVTDYWDTQEHKFSDPKRGEAWEGANDQQPGLKPYQDYACRIQGEALVEVSRNFNDAWNRASGGGAQLTRQHDPASPPAGLARTLTGTRHSAQIVRTQPTEKEKTIARLYRQASSFARRYIYVENQYFQHTEWAEHLKALRAEYAEGWRACARHPSKLPKLHVMAVIPTPEKGFMVPRTHDTVRALGHGTSMRNQDKMVEDELKRHRQNGQGDLSPIAQSAAAVGDKDVIAKDLEGMGLRALMGSLWTFNDAYLTTQREELQCLKEWESTATDNSQGEDVSLSSQRTKALREKIFKARYREIYIHSKLMLIDDGFFMLGSANLNVRSMAVDSEINVASDSVEKSTDLRKRVWGIHTAGTQDGGDGSPAKIEDTFRKWEKLLQANARAKDLGNALTGFLVPFEDDRTSRIRMG
ncbi:phospholipase D-like domain-containing protein [Variovorax humicola]|uniref:Phospholipase D-like domain-containing protein n=1 Tax=Variovorax humicola TaxID=1769758 RepID=A0ABU8WDX9_9BURK